MASINVVNALNAIRTTASSAYQTTVPMATMSNITDVGTAILSLPASLVNEFLSTLVNKIGLQLINDKSYTNPLNHYRKGTLEYGQAIEDIFIEMAKPFEFVAGTRTGETAPDPFSINKPEVKTAYYSVTLEKQYHVTIHENDLKRAFHTENGLISLVSGIMQSIRNGEEYDDYRSNIGLLARQVEASIANTSWKGEVKLLSLYNSLNSTTLTSANCLNDQDFLQFMSNQFKKWSSRLENPRKDLNNAGVLNWIPKERQEILLLGDIQADIDTNLMAWAYNAERLQIGAFKTIDNWYSIGADETVAITALTIKPEDITVKGDLGLGGTVPVIGTIYDPDMMKVYTKVRRMSTMENPKGLYYNVFSTFADIFACSPFHNFVIFTLR